MSKTCNPIVPVDEAIEQGLCKRFFEEQATPQTEHTPRKIPIKIPEHQLHLFPNLITPVQLEFDFGESNAKSRKS